MWRPTRLALAAVLITPVCVAAMWGCGSSSDSGASSRGEPTATATTPQAPQGASLRSCGNTTVAGTEQLRVTGVGCDVGRGVVAAWYRRPVCSSPAGESRFSCAVREYRCLAAASEGDIAVSCARPGSSISFLARRG